MPMHFFLVWRNLLRETKTLLIAYNLLFKARFTANWIILKILIKSVVCKYYRNPCGKISWQSIVWSGVDLAMSRPASLVVLVWVRSGAGQHSMTKKLVCRVEKFHGSLLSDMDHVWQCPDRLVWKFWCGSDLAWG